MYGVEYGRGNRLFRVTGPGAAGAAVEFVAGVFHPTTPKDQFPPDAATAAGAVKFHGLHGVAVGRDGLVYVADTFNHRIRAYDPATGSVRVVAGSVPRARHPTARSNSSPESQRERARRSGPTSWPPNSPGPMAVRSTRPAGW
ncbi:MAG: hypothetical protein EBX35_04645 [Planctomycetia bacterium]|nr:hypothetical protein [Planctomycetia bacterium]